MFSVTIITCSFLMFHGGGDVSTYAAAAIAPSGSPTWWGAGVGDIPIMGDHFHRRPKREGGRSTPRKGSRRSSSPKRERRRGRDAMLDADTYDASDDDGDAHPLYFLDQSDDDEEQWRGRHEYDRRRRRRQRKDQPLDSFRLWALEKTGVHIPRINLHFDPITVLKLRKSWHNILPGAIIRVGADFETHRLGRGLWRLRGCIEDKLIGGRFTIKERRRGGDDEDRAVLMEYSKSWLFAGTGSIGTRFNLCAAYDLTTHRGSARFGFRAENTDAVGSYQLMPGRKGFSIVPIIPLDADRRMFLEAKTNIDLPEPEFVIGTDFDGVTSDGGSLGMGIGGDIDVEVEQVNLIFSF